MDIKVYHKDWNTGEFVHVANVDIGQNFNVEHVLEYAYRWTNNVEGSWSIKEKVFDDGHVNGDYNERVDVVAPLHIIDGRTYGLRSTSIDDMMIINGEEYIVNTFGFRKNSN